VRPHDPAHGGSETPHLVSIAILVALKATTANPLFASLVPIEMHRRRTRIETLASRPCSAYLS
jgi:hypothetical protein